MVEDPVHPLGLLPHHPPFLFLDRIARVTPGSVAAGWKRISAADCPSSGAWPRTFLVEMMAQTAAALVFEAGGEEARKVGALASIPEMRFLRAARPGETVTAKATVERRWGEIIRFAVEARIDGDLAAEGVLVVAIPRNAREHRWNRSS